MKQLTKCHFFSKLKKEDVSPNPPPHLPQQTWKLGAWFHCLLDCLPSTVHPFYYPWKFISDYIYKSTFLFDSENIIIAIFIRFSLKMVNTPLSIYQQLLSQLVLATTDQLWLTDKIKTCSKIAGAVTLQPCSRHVWLTAFCFKAEQVQTSNSCWAIQVGLLTPLTFAQNHLNPLAAFTSGE